MKLEETQSTADIEKFIDAEPAKMGKPMVKNLIARVIMLNSLYLRQLLSVTYDKFVYSAYCDGKIGTPKELQERYKAWLVKNFPQQEQKPEIKV